MEPEITFSITEDSVGQHIMSHWVNGPSGRLIIPSQARKSERYGPHVASLHAGVSLYAMTLGRAASTLNANGIRDRALKDAVSLSPSFKALQKAGIEGRIETVDWRSRWLSAREKDPFKDSETRAWASSQKQDVVLKAALENRDIAAALVDNWTTTGVAPALRPQIENELIRMNLAERYRDQKINMVKPTANHPLLSGVDRDAVQNAMSQAIALHEANCAEVDTVETILKHTTDFVAVTADVHRERAFELLTA